MRGELDKRRTTGGFNLELGYYLAIHYLVPIYYLRIKYLAMKGRASPGQSEKQCVIRN